MPSIADIKRTSIAESLGLSSYEKKSLSDLEWDFFSTESGLAPKERYSLADHKYAWYKLQLGADAPANASLRGLERAYYASLGATGKTHQDLEWEVFNSLGGLELNFASIPGLALYLDSRKAFGDKAVLAYDNFDRSKNLAPNPSFENGTSGYQASTGLPTLAVVAGAARSGAQGLEVTATAETAKIRSTTPSAVLVTPGQVITVSAHVKAPSITRLVRMEISPLDESNIFSTSSSGPQVALTPTHQRISHTYTVPASGVAKIVLGVRVDATVAGEVYHVDDVQIEVGSKATPFTWGDANNLGVSESGHAWTAHTGTWGIEGSQAKITTSSGSENLVSIDVGVADIDVSVTLVSGTDGIILRGTVSNDRILVDLEGGDRIVVNNQGVNTTLVATGGLIPTPNRLLRCILVGPTLSVYLDGVLRGTVNVGTAHTTTRVGLRGWNTRVANARWDNFSVRPVALVDGDAASVWPDLSGNYRHAFQTDATKRPLYRTLTGPKNLLTYNAATLETDTAGWQQEWNIGSIARSTAVSADHGLAVLAFTSAADGTMRVRTTNTLVPTMPGRVIGGTIRLLSSVARSVNARLRFLRTNGTAFSAVSDNIIGTVVTSSTSVWTTLTVVAVAPSDVSHVALQVDVSGTLASEVHNVDAAGLFELASISDPVPAWVPPVTLPNNKPVMQFDGADFFAAQTVLSGLNEATAYVVVRRTAGFASYGTVIAQNRAATWVNPWASLCIRTANTPHNWSAWVGDYDNAGPAKTLTDGTAGVLTAKRLGTNDYLYVNGDTGAVSASPNTLGATDQPFHIGANRTPAEFFHGDIQAILVYEGAHDDATRKRIEKALGRIAAVSIAA